MWADLTDPVPETDVELIATSGFFDRDWYMTRYPDVVMTGLDPAEHYLAFGAKLLRDPSKHFSSSAYLRANPDVASSNINPLVHYLRYGCSEGRSIEAGEGM